MPDQPTDPAAELEPMIALTPDNPNEPEPTAPDPTEDGLLPAALKLARAIIAEVNE